MPKFARNDITGKKFGRLLALQFLPDDSKFSSFLFLCDCGVEKKILAQSVIRGHTVSCGCYQKNQLHIRKKHGQSGVGRTKTYNSWAGMMDRCEWGGHPSYKRYGAKGIKVDDRWHDFVNFLQDMGERPEGMSIDRIDNKKGYSPENCRWANRKTQALNMAKTLLVEHDGETIPFMVFCEKFCISLAAIRARARRRGNDYTKALQSIGINVEVWRNGDVPQA